MNSRPLHMSNAACLERNARRLGSNPLPLAAWEVAELSKPVKVATIFGLAVLSWGGLWLLFFATAKVLDFVRYGFG